jgi:hypothetical protein
VILAYILAYIDPGAGSLVIQAIIAGIVSVPFFFRTRLRAVLDRVRNRSRHLSRPPTDEG